MYMREHKVFKDGIMPDKPPKREEEEEEQTG